jgi:site-specific DNA recombinase
MENKIWDINGHARVLGYGRVSTEDQRNNYSPGVQLEAYEKDKKRYNWVELPFMFESGSGTSISERPVFQEALRMVQCGEVDAVWVIDPDRLCRPEDLRLWMEIYEIFVENDVKLVTPSRIYDLNVNDDLFMYDVQGILAKHNRRRLLQNMNRGKLAKAKDGKNAGGSAPDGFLVDPKTGKYIHDPDRKEYARLGWDLLFNHDFTLRQLVKEYEKRGIHSKSGKKWSLTHCHDMFYNIEYLGHYVYGRTKVVKDRKTGKHKIVKVPQKDWIIVENAHEALVTPEVFYGVQEKLRWRRKRVNHNTHLLTGIATCYLCGSPLHVKYSGEKRKIKYVCTNKKNGCVSRWLDFYDLNDRIYNKFKLLLENPHLIEKLAEPLKNIEFRLRELRDKQQKIQGEITRIETKKQKLLDLYLDGKYSKADLDAKKEELEKNILAYRNEYNLVNVGVRALEEQPNDLTEIIKYMKVLHYTDTKLTYDQRVRIFRQFVFRVRLDERLEFEMELYRTPLGDIPANFRSFPKDLPETAVKGAVLDSFGQVLGSDKVASSQANQCAAHL